MITINNKYILILFLINISLILTTESFQERDLQQVQTYTQNPIRKEICDKSDYTGEISSSRFQQAVDSYNEYRSNFGDPIGKDLLKGDFGSASSKIAIFIILGLTGLFLIIGMIIQCLGLAGKFSDKSKGGTFVDNSTPSQQTKTATYLLFGCLAFTALIAFSTSIAGFVYTGSINNDYLGLKCSVVSALDDLNSQQQINYQGKVATFLGLIPLQQKLQSLYDELDGFLQQLSKITGSKDLDFIQASQQQMTDTINYLEGQTGNWFTYTKQVIASGNTDSLYFKDGVYGPVNQGGTLLNNMVYVMKQASEVILDQLSQGTKMASELVQNINLKVYIVNGQTQISNTKFELDNLVSQINDLTSPIDQAFAVTSGFQIFLYCVYVIIAVLCFVIVPLGHFKKMYKVKTILHVAWIVLGVCTLITVIFAIIFGLLSVVVMEVCTVAGDALTDPKELSSLNLFEGEISDIVKVCKKELGGKGNVLANFGLDSQISQFSGIQDQLNEINMQSSSNQDSLTSLQGYFRQVNQQHTLLRDKGYWWIDADTDNLVSSGDVFLADQNEAQAFLNDFNQGMQGQLQAPNNADYVGCFNPQNGYYEKIVFDKVQCGPNDIVIASTGNFNIKLRGSICIVLPALKKDQNSLDYDARYSDCNATNIKAKYQKLFLYLDEVNQMVSKQTDNGSTEDRVTLTSNLVSQLDSYVFGLESYKLKFSNLFISAQPIFDNIDQITNNVNCLFFGDRLDDIYDQACVNLNVSLYRSFKITIVLVFSNFFFTFLIYKVGQRFNSLSGEHTGSVVQIHPSSEVIKINQGENVKPVSRLDPNQHEQAYQKIVDKNRGPSIDQLMVRSSVAQDPQESDQQIIKQSGHQMIGK